MYARRIGDREYTFGVSGLLYRSNVLMYDHQSESLWLQVKREAVTGPMTGTPLHKLPSTVTSWSKWKKKYPASQVMSLKTGYDRDYARDPYESYYKSRKGLFRRFFTPGPGAEEKELVAGLVVGGAARAYPLRHLRQKVKVDDVLGGEKIRLTFHDDTDRISAKTGDGGSVEPIVAYWFVWKGIHPDTDLYLESDK